MLATREGPMYPGLHALIRMMAPPVTTSPPPPPTPLLSCVGGGGRGAALAEHVYSIWGLSSC